MSTQENINPSSLTLFDPGDGDILAELSDADWKEEKQHEGSNHVLSGMASDGTWDTLMVFMGQGHDTVRYAFVREDGQFEGEAFLLAPEHVSETGGALVSIESPTRPIRAHA